MNDVIVFGQSILEILSIYFLLTVIDSKNRIETNKLIIGLIIIASGTTLINYLQIPYHLLFLLIITGLCFKLFSRNKLKYIMCDWAIALLAIFCFQFAVILILGLFIENVTETGSIAWIVLIIENILAYLATRFNPLDMFLETYYRNNRGFVFLAVAILLVLIITVTNIWDKQLEIFWTKRIELLILTILYIVLNVMLIISFYKHMRENHKIKLKEEHERYLTRIAEEMAAREHEYKNHLNAIIGIATFNKERPLEAIIDYSNELLQNEKLKDKLSPISNNVNIASFINYEAEIAKKSGIDFNFYTEKPFPSYEIPDAALIEILSNLINNAFEAVSRLDKEKRNVYLGIESSEIVMKNYVGEALELDNMFEIGNSSKGAGRGYGLNVILKNCKKYGIKFSTYMQDKYIIINLNMIKKRPSE